MFLILHGAVIGWVLLGCAMLCGALIRRATPRVRARNAALAGLAAIAMSYGISRVLLATTALRLEGTGAWVAVQVAATSPLRSLALARAREILAARIIRNIPPPVAGEDRFVRDALAIDGPPVDQESIARYRALSTSDDCVDTTTFLAGVALQAPAATNAATDTAVACGRKSDAAASLAHGIGRWQRASRPRSPKTPPLVAESPTLSRTIAFSRTGSHPRPTWRRASRWSVQRRSSSRR